MKDDIKFKYLKYKSAFLEKSIFLDKNLKFSDSESTKSKIGVLYYRLIYGTYK